jgi:hypothetical protein
MLEQTAEFIKRAEAQRDAFVAELQRAIDVLKPIDDGYHVHSVGRATEILKKLQDAIQREQR